SNRNATEDGLKTKADAEAGSSNSKLDRLDEKEGRTNPKNEAYRRILRSLEIRQIDEGKALGLLRAHSRKFGITDDEFPAAVDNLVTTFFKIAANAGSKNLSRKIFDEILVG